MHRPVTVYESIVRILHLGPFFRDGRALLAEQHLQILRIKALAVKICGLKNLRHRKTGRLAVVFPVNLRKQVRRNADLQLLADMRVEVDIRIAPDNRIRRVRVACILDVIEPAHQPLGAGHTGDFGQLSQFAAVEHKPRLQLGGGVLHDVHLHLRGDIPGIEGHSPGRHTRAAEIKGLCAGLIRIPAIQIRPVERRQLGLEYNRVSGIADRSNLRHIFRRLMLGWKDDKADGVGRRILCQCRAGHRIGDRVFGGRYRRADVVNRHRTVKVLRNVLHQIPRPGRGPGTEGHGVIRHADALELKGGQARRVCVIRAEVGRRAVTVIEVHVRNGVQSKNLVVVSFPGQVQKCAEFTAVGIIGAGILQGCELYKRLPVDGGIGVGVRDAVLAPDVFHIQAVGLKADVIIEGGVRRHGKLCRFLRPVGTGVGIFQVGSILIYIGVVADKLKDLLLRGQVEGLDAVELAAPHRLVAVGLIPDRHIDVIQLADLAFTVAGPNDRYGYGQVILAEGELAALPCHDHVAVGVTVALGDPASVEADNTVIVYGEGRVGKADMVIGKAVDALRLLPAG